jgi:exopolysaccharide biosynthesis polyprenyl glycosylphosphotransferase
MADTTCEQDEDLRNAETRMSDQHLVDFVPVVHDDPIDDAYARGGSRHPSWMHPGTAVVGALASITALAAWTLVAAAGEPTFMKVLTWSLVVALALVLAFGMRMPSLRRPLHRTRREKRIALIGSQVSAVTLNKELATNRITAYESVGWIASGTGPRAEFPMPQALGELKDLASLVERHNVDLLLIGSDVPRLAVFDELVRVTDIVGVRVCELTAFYEDAFGHIPVTEINSAWFQYVMHPKFRPSQNRMKRVVDLTLSAALGIAVAPLLLVAAVLVKLDGGPVLYRQRRIGAKGRAFTIYKLRTMRDRGPDPAGQTWCGVEDPRVTSVGRLLRRLHIDELPQLYNVLRGEMSVVGPRPEQPDIVAQLETRIAFYSRRHLIKPGLAGWAQLQCGYARSERGSAWKLCHDLYYLKHQSLRFDMVILARTFLALASPHDRSASATVVAAEPPTAFASYEPVPAASGE